VAVKAQRMLACVQYIEVSMDVQACCFFLLQRVLDRVDYVQYKPIRQASAGFAHWLWLAKVRYSAL